MLSLGDARRRPGGVANPPMHKSCQTTRDGGKGVQYRLAAGLFRFRCQPRGTVPCRRPIRRAALRRPARPKMPQSGKMPHDQGSSLSHPVKGRHATRAEVRFGFHAREHPAGGDLRLLGGPPRGPPLPAHGAASRPNRSAAPWRTWWPTPGAAADRKACSGSSAR